MTLKLNGFWLSGFGVSKALFEQRFQSRGICVMRLPHLRRSTAYFLSLCCLLVICASKATALPPGELVREQVNFDIGGSSSIGAWVLDFTQQPFAQRHAGLIEFSSLIAANGQPITDERADKKAKNANELGVVSDNDSYGWDDLFKEHGLMWAFLFVFGVWCGGGFGGFRR